MMLWILSLTLSALVLPVQAGEDEAEKLFRQVEKNLLAAKTVQVEFDVNYDPGKAKGALVLGESDKMRMSRAKSATLIGDGHRIHTIVDQRNKPVVRSTKVSPDGMGKSLRAMLLRPGILLEFPAITGRARAYGEFKVSEFKLGDKDKLGDVDARIIECTAMFKGPAISLRRTRLLRDTTA
jgi:hypothetical protein